ncbi:MAG: DsbA family protein [Chloroflexi bacterium]|nr:DsbA family protein [Chloroflexota bacterium]MCL5276041.1 DsbA family protein [Chloroflexota bacterium]
MSKRREQIERQQAQQRKQTPTIFVNGKAYSSALNADDFRRIFAQVAPDVKLQ